MENNITIGNHVIGWWREIAETPLTPAETEYIRSQVELFHHNGSLCDRIKDGDHWDGWWYINCNLSPFPGGLVVVPGKIYVHMIVGDEVAADYDESGIIRSSDYVEENDGYERYRVFGSSAEMRAYLDGIEDADFYSEYRIVPDQNRIVDDWFVSLDIARRGVIAGAQEGSFRTDRQYDAFCREYWACLPLTTKMATYADYHCK